MDRVSSVVSFDAGPVWPTCPLDAHFADADFACGAHYRRPGIVKQGDSVFATLACIFRTILPGIDT
jgi:hypothetical protein